MVTGEDGVAGEAAPGAVPAEQSHVLVPVTTQRHLVVDPIVPVLLLHPLPVTLTTALFTEALHHGPLGEAVPNLAAVEQNHDLDLARILLLHTVATAAVDHLPTLHPATLTIVQYMETGQIGRAGGHAQ